LENSQDFQYIHCLGGKFRDKVPVYLDRSGPEDVTDLDEWRKLTEETLESGYTKFKFDVDYTAPDFVTDVWSRSIGREQMLAIEKRLSVATRSSREKVLKSQ
jgi:L-alanine-DL-glutamate epimerase-like enolase superfamily enzyme